MSDLILCSYCGDAKRPELFAIVDKVRPQRNKCKACDSLQPRGKDRSMRKPRWKPTSLYKAAQRLRTDQSDAARRAWRRALDKKRGI